MDETAPVVQIRGRFADDMVAAEVADALNRWFRWILDGTPDPAPPVLEPFGLDTGDYAWSLEEDVDWLVGPHARTVGEEVCIEVETHDTHLHLAGLLRRLGAVSARVVREDA